MINFCVPFSQFRITVFTQSRIELLKHQKPIGPYARQFDHSVKYLVSIKTSANPSLSFPTISCQTHPSNPDPTHPTKPYSILRYSTILNIFIVHQYYLIYKKATQSSNSLSPSLKLEHSTRQTLHHGPQSAATHRTAPHHTPSHSPTPPHLPFPTLPYRTASHHTAPTVAYPTVPYPTPYLTQPYPTLINKFDTPPETFHALIDHID